MTEMKGNKLPFILAQVLVVILIWPILVAGDKKPSSKAQSTAINARKPDLEEGQEVILCPAFMHNCMKRLLRSYNNTHKRTSLRHVKIMVSTPGHKPQGAQALLRFYLTPVKFKAGIKKAKNNPTKDPKGFPVALVALAIYVNTNNQLKGLTIPQIDAIYSKYRKLGFPFPLTKWGQLGLTGYWTDSKLYKLGAGKHDVTTRWFKQVCLLNGDFNPHVTFVEEGKTFFSMIALKDKAIGFNIFVPYKKNRIKALAIAREEGTKYILPSRQNIQAGNYPLTRLIVLKLSNPKDPRQRGFLNFTLSRTGQSLINRCGLISLGPRAQGGRGN